MLIGLSRTDWNLISLLNGCDCCGIPIVCSECIVHFTKRENNTGADLDYYLCALKTLFFCSSELGTFLSLRSFFRVYQRGLILSWNMGASLFKCYKWAGSSWLTPPVPPLIPSRQRKVLLKQFPFPLSLVPADLTWWNITAGLLKRIFIMALLHVNMSFTFIFFTILHFLPKILQEKINIAHLEAAEFLP